MKGLGKTSFIPIQVRSYAGSNDSGLTVSEVHINIVGSYVGCHCYNWNVWSEFSYTDGSRDTVQVGHNDIHKDEIILARSIVDLVYGFEAITLRNVSKRSTSIPIQTYSSLYPALKGLQKFRTNLCTHFIVLHE